MRKGTTAAVVLAGALLFGSDARAQVDPALMGSLLRLAESDAEVRVLDDRFRQMTGRMGTIDGPMLRIWVLGEEQEVPLEDIILVQRSSNRIVEYAFTGAIAGALIGFFLFDPTCGPTNPGCLNVTESRMQETVSVAGSLGVLGAILGFTARG